jgi:ribonuclease P protein component
MVSRLNRFSGTNSLNYVYREGKTLRTKYFTIKFAPNSRRQTYRVAVVVSKKVSKSAPERNRIRRRLYELIRVEAAEKLPNLDIVISIFDAEVAIMPASDLKKVFLGVIDDLLKQV